jgi:hypothetical protein
VLRLRIDQRIPDNGIITSGETASEMRIALSKSRLVMTGGQAVNAVLVLNQETSGLLDKISLKSRRLLGEFCQNL